MVSRKLLYAGVFLVAAGAAMLLVRGEAVDETFVLEALRFWPVLVIGLGVGLVLRGTRFRLAGGMIAAAMPGLLLGGLVMAAPDMTPECRLEDPAAYSTRQGTFERAASVDLRIDCGELSITTTPGTGWRVRTGETSSTAPTVGVSTGRLSVRSAEQRDHLGLPFGSDSVAVSLPTGSALDLSAEVNVGIGRLDLTGTQLGAVDLRVNVGELEADLTGTQLGRLSVTLNGGEASVRLPATGDFDVQFDVNAAEIEVCAPAGLGLRITQDVVLGSTNYSGLVRNGDAWETPGYSTATHHADVTVSVNVGSVDVTPEGDCK